jgi:hypothetical protein
MLCSASNSDTLASGNGGSRRNRCFSSSKEWLRSATYGPYYRVRADGFKASFLPNPDEVLDEVCNVDAEVNLPDGSRWSATIFTVAEVGRLMKQWEETGEAAGGWCFWCSDKLIVRDPGIRGMVDVIAELLASEEFDGAFHRLDDSQRGQCHRPPAFGSNQQWPAKLSRAKHNSRSRCTGSSAISHIVLRAAEYQVMIPSPLLNRRSLAEKRGLRHERPSILAVERRRREIAM